MNDDEFIKRLIIQTAPQYYASTLSIIASTNSAVEQGKLTQEQGVKHVQEQAQQNINIYIDIIKMCIRMTNINQEGKSDNIT